MSVSHQDLKRDMSSKTDEELHDILYAHSGDYTADALDIAKEEFLGRKIDARTLSSLGTAAEELRRQEEARLGWPLRIVAFFFSTLLFGIPVMLAHRHFVEKGARRKARDWGRWGLFGLAFYVALFIIRVIVPGLFK